MTYIKKSLGDDETIIRVARFPWIHYAIAWGSLIVLGIFVVGIVIFAKMMVYFIFTEIGVTNRRVIIKTGWIRRKTTELPLGAIELVEIKQTASERIFGFGKVMIAGAGTGELITPTIADPIAFRTAISDARASLAPPTPNQAVISA